MPIISNCGLKNRSALSHEAFHIDGIKWLLKYKVVGKVLAVFGALHFIDIFTI